MLTISLQKLQTGVCLSGRGVFAEEICDLLLYVELIDRVGHLDSGNNGSDYQSIGSSVQSRMWIFI